MAARVTCALVCFALHLGIGASSTQKSDLSASIFLGQLKRSSVPSPGSIQLEGSKPMTFHLPRSACADDARHLARLHGIVRPFTRHQNAAFRWLA